jgi:hypothetical protein
MTNDLPPAPRSRRRPAAARSRRRRGGAALRPGGDRRQAQRGQVDAAERAGGPEDQHHLGKAQTTRHRITGVRTEGNTQFVFVDTPGFQTKHSSALNRSLNKAVTGVIADVDVVLFVVEAGNFTLGDAKVLSLLRPASRRSWWPTSWTWCTGAASWRPGCATCRSATLHRIHADLGQERQGRRARAGSLRQVPARAALVLRRRRTHRPQREIPGQRDDPREAVPPDRRRAAVHVHGGHREVQGRTQPQASACCASPPPSWWSATATRRW